MLKKKEQRESEVSRPRVAVTMGDPNGIGPEVIIRSLADSRLGQYIDAFVVGSAAVLKRHMEVLGLHDIELSLFPDRSGRITVLDISPDEEPPVEFGKVTASSGRLAMISVERAVRMCHSREADAMVTAPISKKAVHLAGFSSPGHTEYIAGLIGASAYMMMMVSDNLRIGLVTTHIPIHEVPSAVTRESILDKIEVVSRSLQTDFGVSRPRIAVLGLNPHAGEGGVLGQEERETIIPAIEQANEQGFHVSGPHAADGFFGTRSYLSSDAVLAMYHDQGLVPFKTLTFNTGVNFTAGLSIIRTSPDHGTAFDIAGRGKAVPDSLRTALYVATDIARRRAQSTTQVDG